MEYEIISIELRPWWKRMWWINDWRVTVKDEDGVFYSFNTWGNQDNPNPSSLLYSIEKKIRRKKRIVKSESMMKTLIGTKVHGSTGSASK